MVLNVQELRKKIEDYFKRVTKDQLLKDLVDSGLEVYSKSEYKIGEFIGAEKQEQMVIASTGATNNFDIFCGTVSVGENIVGTTYLWRVHGGRSANKEINAKMSKATPTSASSFDWSQYEYQYGT
jgi:hypothetical protein